MEKKLSGNALSIIAHTDISNTDVAPASAQAEWRSFGLLAMGASRKDKKLGLALLEQWKNRVCDHAGTTKQFISAMDGVYLGETIQLLRYKPDYKPFLTALFPVLLENIYHLFQYNNSFEDGMITLQNPVSESEPYLGYGINQLDSPIQAPGYQTAVLWSAEYLISLGYKLKADVEALILNNELAVFSFNEKLWLDQESQYGILLLKNHQIINQLHSAAFCPLACGAPTQEQAEAILRHLQSPQWRPAPYGLPLTGLFNNDHVDLFLNWLIFKGLLRYDMYAAATRLSESLLQNIAQNGIYEQYDAANGIGLKNANSPYAAALVLDLLYSI